jgi:hypothetical protein
MFSPLGLKDQKLVVYSQIISAMMVQYELGATRLRLGGVVLERRDLDHRSGFSGGISLCP